MDTSSMSDPGDGQMPARRVVASYGSYREAERAVDHLADSDFAVEHVAIVGRDLEFVEQVTGRFGWGQAIGRGALLGAAMGALLGWLFFAFDWVTPVVARGWLILDGLWIGALTGILFSVLAYAVTRGRRDFASVGMMRAKHYDVMVDGELADQAERLLSRMRDVPPPAPGATTSGGPAPTPGVAPSA